MIFDTAALISIGGWLGNKLLDKGFDTIYESVSENSFNDKFYSIVKIAIKKHSLKYTDAFGGNLDYLFKREDVFNELVKLLFVDSKVDMSLIEEKFDSKSLPKEFLFDFIKILKQELYLDSNFKSILSNKEIYLTTVGINENLEEVIKYSSLSLNELTKIRGILTERFKTTFSQSEFIAEYRDRIIAAYSRLNFIGLGVDLSIRKGKKKKLEELFVKPLFHTDKDNIKLQKSYDKNNEINDVLDFESIFNFNKNLIILGNPGSGKSILTKFITLKLCKKDKKQFAFDEICQVLPFRIELRKYFAFKKDKDQGLLKYLRSLLEIDFGFSNLLEEDVRQILNSVKTMVIFDGLDEIFDVNDKNSVRNDIENFSKEHNQIRTITTSRIIGYEESSLNENESFKLRILSFNHNQIEEYIKNWYSVEEEDEIIRDKEIHDLLSKRKKISNELLSNPLLLSLIVILYRNNLKVPESKLEIYQSCTKTLVDKWDNSKNMVLNISNEIYARKDTIFADLAYWQYNELSTKSGKVTYQRAKNTIATTLKDKLKLVDEFTSDVIAENFLEYAEKRSLYFDNNFTHKTFLEYYTAFWIFSNVEKKHKKDKRNELISEHIDNPFWQIVLELLLNLIDKDQADNEIIDELINYQLTKNSSSYKFFLLIFESLKNIGGLTSKKIVELAVDELIEFAKDNTSKNETKINSLFHMVSDVYASKHNRKLIINAINSYFSRNNSSTVGNVEEKEHLIIKLFLELINNLNRFDNDLKSEIVKFGLHLKIDKYKKSNSFTYMIFTFTGENEEFIVNPVKYAREYIDFFGKKSFLGGSKSTFEGFSFIPFNYIALHSVLKIDSVSEYEDYLNLMEGIKLNGKFIFKDILKTHYMLRNEEDLINIFSKANSLSKNSFPEFFAALAYSARYNQYRTVTVKNNILKALALVTNVGLRNKLINIVEFRTQQKAKDYIIKNFDSKIVVFPS